MLLAHRGRIDAAGATQFGVMMVVLAFVLALVMIATRIKAGNRPYWTGAIAGMPFGLLAVWCFGFAVACRWGVQAPLAWRIAMIGFPISILVCASLLRRAGFELRQDKESRFPDSEPGAPSD